LEKKTEDEKKEYRILHWRSFGIEQGISNDEVRRAEIERTGNQGAAP